MSHPTTRWRDCRSVYIHHHRAAVKLWRFYLHSNWNGVDWHIFRTELERG